MFAKCSAKKNGLQSYCRLCATAARKRFPFKRNVNVEFKARIKYLYGMTVEAFEALWETQGGKCAVCGVALSMDKFGYAIDHNHNTGDIRGLLCSNCNTGIGLLKDSPHILQAAHAYLTTQGHYGRAEARSP